MLLFSSSYKRLNKFAPSKIALPQHFSIYSTLCCQPRISLLVISSTSLESLFTESQSTYMPPTTFQHSLDSDVELGLPSWTTLSTGGTSEEEDTFLPDSHATTPEPFDQLEDQDEQPKGQTYHSPIEVKAHYIKHHNTKAHQIATGQTPNPHKRNISQLLDTSNLERQNTPKYARKRGELSSI